MTGKQIARAANDALEIAESAANFLRGMSLDPRIPQDIRQAAFQEAARIDHKLEPILAAVEGEL